MTEQKDTNQPTIDKVKIYPENYDEVDLKGVMTEFSVFENIMNDYTILEIELNEHLNLIEILPIKGGEKLRINFRTEENFEIYDYEFTVYKISDVEAGQQKNKTYTIHAISSVFFNDKKYKLSRRFDDKPDAIVESIVSNQLDETLEKKTPTKFKQSIVVPNWSPLQTINYMSRVSLANDDSSSLFFFYQAKDKFYYQSLSDLFRQDVPDKKIFQWKNDSEDAYEKTYTKIKSLNVLKENDVFKNYFNGVFGSKLFTYDLINKSYSMNEETYDNLIDVTESLNNQPFHQDLEKSSNSLFTFETNVYNHKHIEEWYQLFLHELGKIRNSQVLRIVVPGNSNLKIGDIIKVVMPSTKAAETEEDPFLSGKYLVMKVRHQVAKEMYNTILEIMKESNK